MPATSPGRASLDLPWASFAGLVLLLALVVHCVSFMASERARRLAADQAAAPPRASEVAPRDYVIPPGREDAVRQLLAPVAEGALPGVAQYSFSIQKSSIRVQLFAGGEGEGEGEGGGEGLKACGGPNWIAPPGALELARRAPPPPPSTSPAPAGAGVVAKPEANLWLTWHWCGEPPATLAEAAGLLVEQLGARAELDQIWQPLGEPVEVEPPPPPRPRESGMLAPTAAALGLDLEQLSNRVLILGTLLALGVGLGLGPRLPDARPPPSTQPSSRPRLLLIGLAVLALALACVALRLELGAERVFDTDESWARPLTGSLFAENHDPWVHPPLFHLVQQPWIRARAWTADAGLLELRAPMIAAGLLASLLALATLALWSLRGPRPWLLVLAPVCALTPALGSTLVLARPYALAAMFVVICAVALWPAPPAPPRSGVCVSARAPAWSLRLRWSVTLLAAGLAAWTDVIAGAAAAMLIAARLVTPAPERPRAWLLRLVPLLVLALWLLPLVPGVLEANRHHVDPELPQATLDALGIARPGDVRPDPKLTRRLPAFCVLGLDAALVPVGLLGVASLVALATWSWVWRRRRVEGLVPLVMLGLWLIVASQMVHLRARNVAFAPLLTVLLAAAALSSPRSTQH